ncbi:MAG TPA: hypothetical protein VK878_09265, partial [Candidatus Deferrimicrobiaceae bacterium]|nr:hypothetical protein [Candidatus Deferrimicrobiaceae bacterium]
MTARRPIPLALAMFRVVGCSGQPGSHAHHGGPAIITTSRQAQAYVDQRLRLRRAWARADVRLT